MIDIYNNNVKMKFNLLISTSQLNSLSGNSLGTGTIEGLRNLAEIMTECGIEGDIYDLPNGSHDPAIASPFSLNNGFALNLDELNLLKIPEIFDHPELMRHLQKISQTYDRFFRNRRTVSYTMKRSLTPWVLEECFSVFKHKKYGHRQQQFEQFKKISEYWLDEYALYEVYKDQNIKIDDPDLKDFNSHRVQILKDEFHHQIEYYQFAQFLCYEQRKKIKEALSGMGRQLIVNLPFGVENLSADVFFHSEVFDSRYQVGCSPEPEHDYPEQAWGIAVYREKTSGLKIYLQKKMEWLSQFGDGVFLDHLVGWCGQYVLPMKILDESSSPHGEFLTEDPEERKENIRWFLDIIIESGLKIRGEIAGDHNRVQATNEVVLEMTRQGYDVGAMVIPRWEKIGEKLKPLKSYSPSILTMVETHDTSTLLQYLINQKGYAEDFESAKNILEFCNRVLALPFFLTDVPLKIEQMGEDIWFEICRRLSEGVPSTDVVFSLPGLISILSEDYRSATIENNINVKPGTSGAVGNGWRNWSHFSPPIKIMQQDSHLKSQLQKLGKRTHHPFDYFHYLHLPLLVSEKVEVMYSKIGYREIVYHCEEGKWRIWKGNDEIGEKHIQLELVIRNITDEEIWERIDLCSVINLNEDVLYRFFDLNDNFTSYAYSSKDLKDNHLFIRLIPDQIHHFLVISAEI